MGCWGWLNPWTVRWSVTYGFKKRLFSKNPGGVGWGFSNYIYIYFETFLEPKHLLRSFWTSFLAGSFEAMIQRDGFSICHHEGPMVPEGSTEHSKTMGFAWDLEISEPSWNTTYHNFLSVINWDDFCQMKTSYFGLHFRVFFYIFSRRHRAIFVCLGLRFLPFAGRFVLPGEKNNLVFPNQQKKPPLKPTTTSTSGPIGSILFDSAWKVPKRLEGWLTFWRFPMGWLDDWRMVVLRRLSHQISNDLQMVFCSQNHHQSQAIAELFTMRVWEVVVIYQECLMLPAPNSCCQHRKKHLPKSPRLLSASTITKTFLASSSSKGTLVDPSFPNSFLNCSSWSYQLPKIFSKGFDLNAIKSANHCDWSFHSCTLLTPSPFMSPVGTCTRCFKHKSLAVCEIQTIQNQSKIRNP